MGRRVEGGTSAPVLLVYPCPLKQQVTQIQDTVDKTQKLNTQIQDEVDKTQKLNTQIQDEVDKTQKLNTQIYSYV